MKLMDQDDSFWPFLKSMCFDNHEKTLAAFQPDCSAVAALYLLPYGTTTEHGWRQVTAAAIVEKVSGYELANGWPPETEILLAANPVMFVSGHQRVCALFMLLWYCYLGLLKGVRANRSEQNRLRLFSMTATATQAMLLGCSRLCGQSAWQQTCQSR